MKKFKFLINIIENDYNNKINLINNKYLLKN
jgi:hypothetical protein